MGLEWNKCKKGKETNNCDFWSERAAYTQDKMKDGE